METMNETMKYGSQEWKDEVKAHKASYDTTDSPAVYLSGNPALYVGTYGKYNSGSLQGAWIDLSTFSDASEFTLWCEEVLHCNEADPELMFQDFENFPEAMYSESANDEELQKIWDWMEYSEEEREILQEYWDEVDSKADPDTILERHVYSGDFSDFAYQEAEEMIACSNAPECVSRYFDYEAWERDLKFDYYVTSNHVFTTN